MTNDEVRLEVLRISALCVSMVARLNALEKLDHEMLDMLHDHTLILKAHQDALLLMAGDDLLAMVGTEVSH